MVEWRWEFLLITFSWPACDWRECCCFSDLAFHTLMTLRRNARECGRAETRPTLVSPPLLVEITQGLQAPVFIQTNDDVIQNFNLEQLAGPDQIPRHLDVGFARCRVRKTYRPGGLQRRPK